MPLLCDAPQPVRAGDELKLDATIALGGKVDEPVTYELRASVEAGKMEVAGSVKPTNMGLEKEMAESEIASGGQE